MLEFYDKLQHKPETVPEFKNALQLIWSTCKRPPQATVVQAWMSANVVHDHHIFVYY